MLSSKMIEAFNIQVNKEIYSGYLYGAMSAVCEHIGLKGFANWFMVQLKEEMEHASRIYRYILEQGGQIRLTAIDQPPFDFASPLDMFEKTLSHEKIVTRSINDLMELAVKEKDHASQIFLQWFVTEQIEEEANPAEIIAKLKLVGKDGNGLFMIDKELAARVFTPSFGTGADAGASAG
jgi:ferritin